MVEVELVSLMEELVTVDLAVPVVAVEEEGHSGSCHSSVPGDHPRTLVLLVDQESAFLQRLCPSLLLEHWGRPL